MTDSSSSSSKDIIAWTADIVASHVQNNSVAISDLPLLIKTVHDSLIGLTGDTPAEKPQPAVSIRRSVTPDFIICLEDGRKLKMLKRHGLWHVAGRIPRKMGVACRLSDGRPQLCKAAQLASQENRARQTQGRTIGDFDGCLEAMCGTRFLDYTVPQASS